MPAFRPPSNANHVVYLPVVEWLSCESGENASVHICQRPLPNQTRIPHPFGDAHDCRSVSVVLKPSSGDFLHDYRLGDDLHVGVADAHGGVHSYWARGVERALTDWPVCVRVCELPDVTGDDGAIVCRHIATVAELHTCIDRLRSEFTAAAYDAHTHNCFDFVVALLFLLNEHALLPSGERVAAKAHFTRDVVHRLLIAAAKFGALYRLTVDDTEFEQKNTMEEDAECFECDANAVTSLPASTRDIGVSVGFLANRIH